MGRRAVVGRIGIFSGLLCSIVVLPGAAGPIHQLALQGADMPAATARTLVAPGLLGAESLEPFRVPGLEGATPTEAQMVEVLTTYAAKQQARVAGG